MSLLAYNSAATPISSKAIKHPSPSGAARASPMANIPAESLQQSGNDTSLVERQTYSICEPKAESRLVGDGNPHLDKLHKQISGVLNCGDGDCSVSTMDQISYEIGFSADGPLTSWLNGGFNVAMSYATGTTNECAGVPGEDVCVWKSIGHMAYTVENGMYSTCYGWNPDEGTSILRSPNSIAYVVMLAD